MLYYLAISKSMLIFEVNITKDPNELTDRFNDLKSDLNKWKTKLNQLDNEIKIYFIFIVSEDPFKDKPIEDCYNLVYLDEFGDLFLQQT